MSKQIVKVRILNIGLSEPEADSLAEFCDLKVGDVVEVEVSRSGNAFYYYAPETDSKNPGKWTELNQGEFEVVK